MSDEMITFKATGNHKPVNVFINGKEVSNSAVEFYGSSEPNKSVKGWAILVKRDVLNHIITIDDEIQYERIEGDVYWIPINASST